MAHSKTTSKLKKGELPDNSENMWSPITTKKRSWELSRTCTQDSIKSVASEDPSSQVDRSKELPLHVPSSRTQRSSSLTRQPLLWMSRVRRLYSKPWIERWREEHRLWSLIVCQPFRSVIELWSCTRELSLRMEHTMNFPTDQMATLPDLRQELRDTDLILKNKTLK